MIQNQIRNQIFFHGLLETEVAACDHPVVLDWLDRVAAAGGAEPSENTKQALCDYMYGLDADGLTDKIHSACCFVPDNLIAAITPLIQGPGFPSWFNDGYAGGFVPADLTPNGLQGDGTKFLKTGFAPADIFSAVNNVGISVYVMERTLGVNPAGEVDTGYVDAAGQDAYEGVLLASAFPDGEDYLLLWDTCNGVAGEGRLIDIGIPETMFISGNRTDDAESYVYAGNSFLPLFPYSFIDTIGGGLPIYNPTLKGYTVFGYNAAFVPDDIFLSTRQMSFVAYHDGLSFADATAFFDRTFLMRTALFGGF